jgi:glycosyltransferase involved in cell wall biosynthesis
MKVLILAGFSKSLIHFRKELLMRMVKNGHEVVAVGPEVDYEEELKEIGVKFVQLKFNRLAINPLNDLKLLIDLIRLMLMEKPDVYFGYTIKPVIYGSIAAWLAGVKKRYAMVTGLGSVFIATNKKKKYVKVIAKMLYKIGFACDNLVFFQNNDDINELVQMNLIHKDKCYLVNGSGVNLEYYSPTPLPDENIFLFIGSVMGDKGVREYMEAASLVKKMKPDARCWIVGPMDNRLTGITLLEMNSYIESGCIEYLGSVEDVRPYLDQCRFYVLPSYREGTPRSVLEAMAKCRPIITTDAPGCRETVIDGVNGFLVPVKDHMTLSEKMIWMIDNPEAVKKMAIESLNIVRKKYDVHLVNKHILEKMDLEP